MYNRIIYYCLYYTCCYMSYGIYNITVFTTLWYLRHYGFTAHAVTVLFLSRDSDDKYILYYCKSFKNEFNYN